MDDIRSPDEGMIAATDAEFIEMVAEAIAAGSWQQAWLPRLLRLARQGTGSPDLPEGALARIFDERFEWGRR